MYFLAFQASTPLPLDRARRFKQATLNWERIMHAIAGRTLAAKALLELATYLDPVQYRIKHLVLAVHLPMWTDSCIAARIAIVLPHAFWALSVPRAFLFYSLIGRQFSSQFSLSSCDTSLVSVTACFDPVRRFQVSAATKLRYVGCVHAPLTCFLQDNNSSRGQQ